MTKILMPYPCHPSLILQLATYFPDYEFVLFQVSALKFSWEMYLRYIVLPSNVKLIATSCNLFPSPSVLTKHLVSNSYDRCILTARTRESWDALHNTKIPTVWVALSASNASLPPEGYTGKVVCANDTTLNLVKPYYKNAKLIYIFKPRSMLPKWVGIEPKGHFMPKCLMVNRIYGKDLEIWQACLPYINSPVEYLDEDKYNVLRSMSRFYIELSHRDNSSAFMESQLMGCPAIVPDRPDFNLFIKDGINGLVYHDEKEAIEHCRRLYSDFKYAQDLSNNIDKIFSKIVDEKKIKKQWEEILK